MKRTLVILALAGTLAAQQPKPVPPSGSMYRLTAEPQPAAVATGEPKHHKKRWVIIGTIAAGAAAAIGAGTVSQGGSPARPKPPIVHAYGQR